MLIALKDYILMTKFLFIHPFRDVNGPWIAHPSGLTALLSRGCHLGYLSCNLFRGGRMESPYKGKTGLRRICNALFYSFDGLAAAYRFEDAFRQEVLLALILVPLAFFMPVNGTGRAMMVSCVLLGLIVEVLNSGIEAVTDRVSLEDHALAKRAKDLGSAAVLLSLINVPVVWLIVLFG